MPELLRRAAYTLARGYAHRAALARILRSPGCERVTDVLAHCAPAEGGRILVLDFDGVLAPHGYDAPERGLNRCELQVIVEGDLI